MRLAILSLTTLTLLFSLNLLTGCGSNEDANGADDQSGKSEVAQEAAVPSLPKQTPRNISSKLSFNLGAIKSFKGDDPRQFYCVFEELGHFPGEVKVPECEILVAILRKVNSENVKQYKEELNKLQIDGLRIDFREISMLKSFFEAGLLHNRKFLMVDDDTRESHDSNLIPFDEFKHLEVLALDDFNYFDLSALGGLKNLKILTLGSVKKLENVASLANSNLEKLVVGWRADEPLNLKPFGKLKKLKRLHLERCGVTPEQIENLRKELPGCKVTSSQK